MAKEQTPKPDQASGKDTGFFENINQRYLESDDAFDNLIGDAGGLFSNITDLSWIPSPEIGVPAVSAINIQGNGITSLLLTLFLAVALFLAAVAITTRILIFSWRLFRSVFLADPGEVMIGYVVREGKTKKARLARFLWPDRPFYQCYDDTLRHWQIMGPTGSGKTTLLEEKIRKNIKEGVTTVILELDGKLGEKVRDIAEIYERQTITLDPSRKDTKIWNPMAGEDKEQVAEQMVNMVASDYVTDQFFRDIAIVLTRHAVIAIKSYEERYGADANVRQLTRFIANREYRDEVLNTYADKSTGVIVRATWIPEYTKNWFQMVYFGHWSADVREKYTTGLGNILERVIGEGALREIICPPDAATQKELEEKDLRIEDAIESGGLVILRLPTKDLGSQAAVATAGWITQRIESATRARHGARPLSFVMDEAHLILGKENLKIAEGFRHWFPVCRNFHVSVKLAYQSFGMIERDLRGVIQGNARTKLMAGGMGPDDGEEAERIAGEKDVISEETRTTRRQLIPGAILSSIGQTVTRGEKESEEAHYPAHRIRALPVGTWLIRTIDHNNQIDPFLIRVPFKGKTRRAFGNACARAGIWLPRKTDKAGEKAKNLAGRLAAPLTATLLAKMQEAHDRKQREKANETAG